MAQWDIDSEAWLSETQRILSCVELPNDLIPLIVSFLKRSVYMFCRIRPFVLTPPFIHVDNGIVLFEGNSETEYKFDRVLGDKTTQTDLFEEIKPLIQSVMDGSNVSIFAYGQTGAGKTFTMEGVENDLGIKFRALTELFRLKAFRKDFIYKIFIRRIYILTRFGAGSFAQHLHAEGSTSTLVENEGDALNYLRLPANNSVLTSSWRKRQDRILSVEVQGENTQNATKTVSQLHLVDLAPSERPEERRQSFSRAIRSLDDVLRTIGNRELTDLYRKSLVREVKTLILVNLSPASVDFLETKRSLNFAACVGHKNVKDLS